ncbi:MAG: DUF6020 family protein [Bacteroidales bacterium]|nr:DUF6020 family protein [Bacteroidales bacterium]MCM1414489.1 DUF6020 family protein [bacterium]MCM1423751.1 DUF6020 family protein [bacterium]
MTAQKTVISAVCALAALLCAGRILLLLYGTGHIYTMGIFPMALVFGFYCLWKKALFYEKVFFSVPVRLFLAAGFTLLQTLGLFFAHPQIAGVPELLLWTVCFTPLTYAGGNFLFAAVAERAESGGFSEEDVVLQLSRREERRRFFGAFAVIFAGFCIPFAAYYPAIMAYDVIPQLDQIRSSGLTTHHPLIHTLYLAACLRLGEAIPFFANADRAGLAIYSLTQMAVVAACFSCVYVFLLRRGVKRWLCALFVLCAAFFPTHGLLAVSITKDTVYAALVMVFAVYTYELAARKESPAGGWIVRYSILSVVLLLFRNNSVYAWIVYAAAVLLALRKKPFFRRICMLHGVIFLLYLALNGLMIRASGATSDTYAREMLSVPAQQIARVVQEHKGELTQQDLQRLSTVWKEELPEYVPAIADRSKRDIGGDKETLAVFAKEWASLGVRYPLEYLKAFLLKNKGVWDMTDVSYLEIYSYAVGYLQVTYPSNQQEYMDVLAPGYVRHQKLQPLQTLYRYFAAGDELWRYCPPMALVMQPAFYCYLLLVYCLCCIGLKKTALLVPAVFPLALLGTLLLGPCVLVRYFYPLMLSVTTLSLLLFGRSERISGNIPS